VPVRWHWDDRGSLPESRALTGAQAMERYALNEKRTAEALLGRD
jgi:hypothetical protein